MMGYGSVLPEECCSDERLAGVITALAVEPSSTDLVEAIACLLELQMLRIIVRASHEVLVRGLGTTELDHVFALWEASRKDRSR
jgi:hypothetical protein